MSEIIDHVIFPISAADIVKLEEVEKRYIEAVLKFTKGNKSQACTLLGIDRRTLYRRLRKFEGSDGTEG